jgi:transmembrane sensor
MTHSPDNPIRQEAARWFQSRVGVDPAPEDEARFQAWLRADPAHAREYRALERLWSRLDELPRQAPPPRWRARAPFLRHAASAVLVLVAAIALGAGYRWHQAQPVFTASYETQAGERARTSLPDGSQVELAAGSRLQVVFYRNRRETALATGEAYFAVAKDAQRPFSVEAGGAKVRVTGTKFSVRFVGGSADVALEEGSIELTAPDGAMARLSAPAAARAGVGGVAMLGATEVERLTGWRRGQLVFHDQPLADVVRELSRYRRAPVAVASSDVGALKVTGVALAERPDAFLEGLANVLPVVLERSADGSIALHPAPAR